MTFITLSSQGQVGPLVDAFEQGGSLAQMPDGQRGQIVSELRAMQKIYDDAAKEAETAAQSQELTPLGRREALKRLATGAVDAMKSHDEKVAAIVRSATDTRAKAIQPPAIERTQEVLMVEREIRDRLVGKDPLEVNVMYVNAIAQGDWTVVNAIERAPAAFALITSDQREAGDMMKLRASPMAPSVIDADNLAFIYQSVKSAVHAELGKLADDLGGEGW